MVSAMSPTTELNSFVQRAEASGFEASLFAREALSQIEASRATLQQRRTHKRNEIDTAADAQAISRALAPLLERLLQRAEQAALLIRQGLRLEALREDLDLPQDPDEEDIWQRALIALGYHRHALREQAGNVRKVLRHAPQIAFRRVWRADWENRYMQVLDDLDDLADTVAMGLDEGVRQA